MVLGPADTERFRDWMVPESSPRSADTAAALVETLVVPLLVVLLLGCTRGCRVEVKGRGTGRRET